MSDPSFLISIAALIVSIISAIFAGWSAWEAKKARRVAKSEYLHKAFDQVEGFFLFMLNNYHPDYIKEVPKGVAFLRNTLSEDKELQDILDVIDRVRGDESFDPSELRMHNTFNFLEGKPSDPKFRKLREIFNARKRVHLKIG